MYSFTFGLLSLVSTVVTFTAAQTPANCGSFWPGIAPGESNTINSNCFIPPEYPVTIGDITVTLAYDDAWRHGDTVIAKREHLSSLILKAATDSISIYRTFAPLSNVVVILGSENFQDRAADTSRPGGAGACQIRLFWGWWGRDATDEFRLQAFAHEMYHCVQDTMFTSLPSNWWTDGTADYFSNVVYPPYDIEWESAAKYSPNVPLWANDAYSTNIFFQALEQSKGMVGVHAAISSWAPGDNAGEKGRLAGVPGMVEDFHLFGRMFSLGQIRDTNGKYVPIVNPPQPASVALIAGPTAAGSKVSTARLTADPFTVSVFQLALDAGQTVSISYKSTQPNVRIAYMLPGSGVWTTMPRNAQSSSAEGTIIAECNNGKSATVMVLLTSTDNVSTAAADITVLQVSEDETCQCKQPGSRKRREGRCPTPSASATSTPTPAPAVCTAAADQPTEDACLTGAPWKVDKVSMEKLLRENLASVPELTINRIAITGDGEMTISGTNATFRYKELTIALDVSAAGMSAPTTTVVNGVFEANLYLQGSSVFCLNVYSGQGTAVGSSPLFGEIMRFDLGPNGGFVEQKYRIAYQCSASRLTMQGTYDGNVAWGPYSFVR